MERYGLAVPIGWAQHFFTIDIVEIFRPSEEIPEIVAHWLVATRRQSGCSLEFGTTRLTRCGNGWVRRCPRPLYEGRAWSTPSSPDGLNLEGDTGKAGITILCRAPPRKTRKSRKSGAWLLALGGRRTELVWYRSEYIRSHSVKSFEIANCRQDAYFGDRG